MVSLVCTYLHYQHLFKLKVNSLFPGDTLKHDQSVHFLAKDLPQTLFVFAFSYGYLSKYMYVYAMGTCGDVFLFAFSSSSNVSITALLLSFYGLLYYSLYFTFFLFQVTCFAWCFSVCYSYHGIWCTTINVRHTW